MLFKETGCLLNGFGKLLLLQMFGHIDFVEVNRIPDLAGTEHRINCRQNHSSNGNNGPFLTSALGDALVFQSIVGDGTCNVTNWKNIIAIAAGDGYTVGLKSDGTVVATGYNMERDCGQCDVSSWRNIIAIAAGKNHNDRGDGRSNRYGKLESE